MEEEGLDFVVCQECGFKGKSLFRHLFKHEMTAAEYLEKHPDAKTACDEMRDRRASKLRAKPKKAPNLNCKYCNGQFKGRVQRRAHERREEQYYLNGEDGKDFVTCLECGFRETNISRHISTWHGMNAEQYREKYPDAPVMVGLIPKKAAKSNKGKTLKKKGEHSDSVVCDKCGDWYRKRYERKHRHNCIQENPEKYEEGREFLRCPECSEPMMRLGRHLRMAHGWCKDKIAIAANEGLVLSTPIVNEKWKSGQDFTAAQKKREQTHLENHGHRNPFSDPKVQEKIKETSRRRYGADHAMKNEDVRIRQNNSAQSGPSELERFFNEHTCDSVVYTGYGGRYIRCKKGVEKYGRIIKDVNPDFMVLPDNVLESARNRSDAREKMDRKKHRTKYVVELLGDYYHSEAVIGVEPERHKQEVIEAYASAGIECLVLWEHEVLRDWEKNREMIESWLNKAMADINENPVWSKRTKGKVDKRKATIQCPYGSGRTFRTESSLRTWMDSLKNYWRPGLEEGRDYVVCLECGGRCQKVAEHLRKTHGMTKEDYLGLHPEAVMVSGAEKREVGTALERQRGGCSHL